MPPTTCQEVPIVTSPTDILAINALYGTSAEGIVNNSPDVYTTAGDEVPILVQINAADPKITTIQFITRNVKSIRTQAYADFESGMPSLSDVCTFFIFDI